MNQVDILSEQFRKAVDNIQSNCKHENATMKYGADTGNYCKADDSYWKDYKCPDCNKQWRVYTK